MKSMPTMYADPAAAPHRTRRLRMAAAVLAAAGLLTTGALTASPAAAAAGCSAKVPGDVNGDGRAEVAVGEPRGAGGAGAVHIFYGHSSGVATKPTGTAFDDQYLTQDSAGVPGANEPGDNFGGTTAFGDFDQDGCADLIVAASGDTGGDGSITVLPGTRSGITTTGARAFSTSSLFGQGSPNERFGGSLAVGDFNHDGIDDVAVGAPGRNVVELEAAGAVAVLFGSPNGLDQGSVKPRLLTRESLLRDVSLPPGPGGGELFGRALAAGDFNGDGVTELAVGAPGAGTTYVGGSVQTLSFAADGTVEPNQEAPIGQATPGVPGDDVADDSFGIALAAGDVDGDGRDELAVGAPGEDCEPAFCDELWGEGAVTLLRGSAKGLTGTNSQLWTQNSAGVSGIADEDDAFGLTLTMGHLNADRYADLAIGAPSDKVGKVRAAGTVTLLLGGSSGLSTKGIGGRQLHQNTVGIADSAEQGDGFGRDLAAVPAQAPGRDSLIIGVPNESIGGVRYTGQFHVIAPGSAGPNTKRTQTLHLNSPGVKGSPLASAGFGDGLS